MDWEGLTDRYGERVFLIVRSVLRDDALSRDVAQEALLRIGRALNGGLSVSDPEAWVLKVAGNAARDALRRKRRSREVTMEAEVVDSREPDERLLREEDRERITRELAALPPGPRDILLLKFREGLSGARIAAALGVTIETAWQRLSRAMRLLKTKLAEES